MGFHFHAARTLSQSPGKKIRPRPVAFLGANQLDPYRSLDRAGDPVAFRIERSLAQERLIKSAFRNFLATDFPLCPHLILAPVVPQAQGKRLIVAQVTKGYSYPKTLRWAFIVLGKAGFTYKRSPEAYLGV